jgi:hypothetical protein
LCLSAGNKRNHFGIEMALFNQSLRSLGAPDSVRCARLATVNWLLSGSDQRRTAINHRTVWWCTILSGEPFTGEVVAIGKRLTAYGYKSPDCPVSQRSAGPTVGRVIRARRVAEPTVRRGHRTVSGAPTTLNLQRSASPNKERDPHRTVRCARRQKARIAFLECSQRLLATLGL